MALRGTGAGLVVPGSTRFELDLLAARLQTRFVAVRDPAADIVVRDRINQAFPRLFRNGARDYGLVYHFEGWMHAGRNRSRSLPDETGAAAAARTAPAL